MNKILLTAVNAKYIHSNLAVYNLKAYANEYKDNIEIAEFTINQYTEDILIKIYEKQPQIIAFSCYIWNIGIVKELITEINKIMPDTKIWTGGPEVSYIAKEFLEEYPQVTGVMVGEGEMIFANLAKYYVDDLPGINDLSQIKGIVYREADRILATRAEEILDLSTIPFIYDDLTVFENKIMYYESSRGCPFSCSYCLSSIDKKLRFKRLDIVQTELKYFLENKVSQVKFVDRTFNCNRSHALAIWKFIHENDNGITNFHFEISADLLREEELQLMKQMRPGLIQLEIGVQSTNLQTIKEIDRTMDLGKLSEVVHIVNQFGNIHQHLDLIAGLPYEDLKSFKQSFNDVYRMKPNQLQLGFLKILSGSKMYQNANEYRIVYKNIPPYEVLYTKWISYDDIILLKKIEEVVEIYYNSGQFRNTIKCLEREFSTPFEMYEQLSIHYSSYILNNEKHSRITRYEILLEFISKEVQDKYEIFKNLLVLDVYLRDNIKTRPAFARSLSPYSESIRQIYMIEEENRKLLPDYLEYNHKQLGKMTHIEVFSKDILAFINQGKLVDRDTYVLFDYKNRNPLNHEARTKVLV